MWRGEAGRWLLKRGAWRGHATCGCGLPICRQHRRGHAGPPTPVQIVAYNKMDVPDSSDYWEDVREQLAGQGVAPDSVFAIRWGAAAAACAGVSSERWLAPEGMVPALRSFTA